MKETPTNVCSREDCFLCKNISRDWLDMVRLKRSVLAFSKGETIFQEGQKVEGIYFILTGKVKVDMAWGDKKYIVRVANDGTILGHRGFGLDDVYPVNAVALETTTVCYITTALFQTLLKTNPTLLYELTFFYADELKRTERRMKNLAHMPVKGRVAESLLQLAQVFGTHADGQLAYSLSRKDLAAMSGSTYETVIRSLTELAQDGLITVKGKSISITDIPKLQACCNRATHAARE